MWKKHEKNSWVQYAWDSHALEVTTNFRIGSNDEIFFEVADADRVSFSRVVVRMTSMPIYYVGSCQNDTELSEIPDGEDPGRFKGEGVVTIMYPSSTIDPGRFMGEGGCYHHIPIKYHKSR